jgi:hypothetical protein
MLDFGLIGWCCCWLFQFLRHLLSNFYFLIHNLWAFPDMRIQMLKYARKIVEVSALQSIVASSSPRVQQGRQHEWRAIVHLELVSSSDIEIVSLRVYL